MTLSPALGSSVCSHLNLSYQRVKVIMLFIRNALGPFLFKIIIALKTVVFHEVQLNTRESVGDGDLCPMQVRF